MRSPRITCRCGRANTATLQPRRGENDRRVVRHDDPRSGRQCDDSFALVDPYTGAWL